MKTFLTDSQSVYVLETLVNLSLNVLIKEIFRKKRVYITTMLIM